MTFKRKKEEEGKLQIVPLKFGDDWIPLSFRIWILSPKI